MKIRCIAYRQNLAGKQVGLADLEIVDIGLVLRDCGICHGPNGIFIGMPAGKREGKWERKAEFINPKKSKAFQAAALEAICKFRGVEELACGT